VAPAGCDGACHSRAGRALGAELEALAAELRERVEDLKDRLAEQTGGGASGGATASFGDGVWLVGSEIQPGTYRSPGGSGCYWARLSGFSGDLDDIIANGGFSKNQTVTIQASDAGFETNGCGTWAKVA
jgi:hypothetical protein